MHQGPLHSLLVTLQILLRISAVFGYALFLEYSQSTVDRGFALYKEQEKTSIPHMTVTLQTRMWPWSTVEPVLLKLREGEAVK
jgi:hypothetical protein